jgi:hypothetical protein
MPNPARRFARHIQLPQVGIAGQAKIGAADVTVGRGFSGWIEARYLGAAGVGAIHEGSHEHADERFCELDPAARDVALGAHAAVCALQKILATPEVL